MKKNKWVALLRRVLLLALLAGLLVGARELVSVHLVVLRIRWGSDGPLAWAIVLTMGAWLLYRLLRHIGYLVFCLCCGYSLQEYSYLGFGLHRDRQGRLRLMRRRAAGRYVVLLMAPPRMGGTSPWRMPLLGGKVLVSVATVAFGVLSWLLGHRPADMALYTWVASDRAYAALLLMPCIWGIVTLAGCCFPDGSGTDLFAQVKRLSDVPEMRGIRERVMYLNARGRQGFSSLEIPEECFAPCSSELLVWPEAYLTQVWRVRRMMALGQFEEAYSLICTLLEQPTQEHFARYVLIAYAAFCEALLCFEPIHVPLLEDPTLQLFLGRESTVYLHAQHAAALLVREDEEEAAQYRARLDQTMRRKPAASIEIGERYIGAVQAAYRTRRAAEARDPHPAERQNGGEAE